MSYVHRTASKARSHLAADTQRAPQRDGAERPAGERASVKGRGPPGIGGRRPEVLWGAEHCVAVACRVAGAPLRLNVWGARSAVSMLDLIDFHTVCNSSTHVTFVLRSCRQTRPPMPLARRCESLKPTHELRPTIPRADVSVRFHAPISNHATWRMSLGRPGIRDPKMKDFRTSQGGDV